MNQLLHLDASPRAEKSRSRQLSREFVAIWQQHHPGTVVTYRDLGSRPPPPVDEDWTVAAYAPPEQQTPEQRAAIAVSDTLVEELIAADVYVFGVPMYNFNVPAPFKAYIDQVVRPGRTVRFGPSGPQGLLTGKKMFVMTARGLGGYGAGGAAETYNFQEPYLRAIFAFVGITDLQFVHSDNTSNPELSGGSLQSAQAHMKLLAA